MDPICGDGLDAEISDPRPPPSRHQRRRSSRGHSVLDQGLHQWVAHLAHILNGHAPASKRVPAVPIETVSWPAGRKLPSRRYDTGLSGGCHSYPPAGTSIGGRTDVIPWATGSRCAAPRSAGTKRRDAWMPAGAFVIRAQRLRDEDASRMTVRLARLRGRPETREAPDRSAGRTRLAPDGGPACRGWATAPRRVRPGR